MSIKKGKQKSLLEQIIRFVCDRQIKNVRIHVSFRVFEYSSFFSGWRNSKDKGPVIINVGKGARIDLEGPPKKVILGATEIFYV